MSGKDIRPRPTLLRLPHPRRAPVPTYPLIPLCGKERKRGQGSFSKSLLSPPGSQEVPCGEVTLPKSRGGVARLPFSHLSPPAAPSAAPLGWPLLPSLPPAPPAGSQSQSEGAQPHAPGPAHGPAPPAACSAPAAAAPERDASHLLCGAGGAEATGATSKMVIMGRGKEGRKKTVKKGKKPKWVGKGSG